MFSRPLEFCFSAELRQSISSSSLNSPARMTPLCGAGFPGFISAEGRGVSGGTFGGTLRNP